MSSTPASPTRPLVDARSAPAETLRLLAQCRDAFKTAGKSGADFFYATARRKIEEGAFLGLLWIGPGEEAMAYAAWEVAGELGRRGSLYLSEGFQRPKILEGFLNRLDHASEGSLPFISWTGDVPGLSDEECASVFSRRGFVGVERADMRFPQGAALPAEPPNPSHVFRPLGMDDEPAIADLLFRVYEEDPFERALFATTSDSREDSRRGAHALLHGEVGRWIPEASFGIWDEGRLIAHTLANELDGGLITEVGVDPTYRRRGLARRLVFHTVAALRAVGFQEPRLVVTLRNERAARLYERIGFVFVPGGSGRVWLRVPALGVGGSGGA
jgi:ribosomal protein S18 acetylase RimI-like enzyme